MLSFHVILVLVSAQCHPWPFCGDPPSSVLLCGLVDMSLRVSVLSGCHSMMASYQDIRNNNLTETAFPLSESIVVMPVPLMAGFLEMHLGDLLSLFFPRF